MPRRSKKPTLRVTVRLFEEDLETLKQFFPHSGYNEAIRKMVNAKCSELRARENQFNHSKEQSDAQKEIGNIESLVRKHGEQPGR